MKFLKAFGRFWYDFIIGDDWKIAVAVVSALGVLLVVLINHVIADKFLAPSGGLLILLFFSISLMIDAGIFKKRQ